MGTWDSAANSLIIRSLPMNRSQRGNAEPEAWLFVSTEAGAVGRLGENNYTRANISALISIEK